MTSKRDKQEPKDTIMLVKEQVQGKNRVGHMLLEAGKISKEEHAEAMMVQKEKGGDLIDILFSLDYLEPKVLLDFLVNYQGEVSTDLIHLEIRRGLISLLPAALAQKHKVVPIDKIGKVILLGAVAPLDETSRPELEEACGFSIKTLICQPQDIEASIARYYSDSEPDAEIAYDALPTVTLEEDVEERNDSIRGLEAPLRLAHVANLIRKISTLPALPETVTRVREAMQNPDISVASIVEVIQMDPPIAAKVLGVANSSAYGFTHKVHDLTLAVSIMGLRETYSIVLSAAVVDLLRKWKGFDYRTFWLDSIYCAAAARIVAKACGQRQLPGVFSAALLHDFGRAALWQVEATKCAKIPTDLMGKELAEAEKEIIGISHAEAGFNLAEHWNLPPEIAVPVRFHHTPEKATEYKKNVAVVAIADLLTGAAGPSIDENKGIFDGHENTLATLDMDVELAEASLEEFLDKREAALRDTFGAD